MNDEGVVKHMSIQGDEEGYHTTMDGVIIECLKKNFKDLHADCKQVMYICILFNSWELVQI